MKPSSQGVKLAATGAAALILGFGGGIAGSALHPGSRGPAGATGPQGVASSVSPPQISCALAERQVPTTGSVVVALPSGPGGGVATFFNTAYLTVDCTTS